jgi:hypothetical protein
MLARSIAKEAVAVPDLSYVVTEQYVLAIDAIRLIIAEGDYEQCRSDARQRDIRVSRTRR